jgi:hypothetical protein
LVIAAMTKIDSMVFNKVKVTSSAISLPSGNERVNTGPAHAHALDGRFLGRILLGGGGRPPHDGQLARMRAAGRLTGDGHFEA